MSALLPSPKTLDDVVRGGMCSGCGVCESIAGRDSVEMALTSEGRERPRVKRPLDAATEARVLAACPGVSVTGPAPEAGTDVHPVWGPVRDVRRTWAADPAVRHRAAAGGTLTALAQHLLDTGEVDTVLHVRASASQPMCTAAQVSHTPGEALSGAQSRYGPAAPLTELHRLLDEGARIALVAKPCDISAVRNLARSDPRIERQVPYMLTLFCGGVPTLETAARIARHAGIEPDEVSVFRWRGEGWPGPTHVEARDGRAMDLTYEDVWYDASAPWKYDIQFRCKVCPDAIGEVADISAPDGWVLEDGRRVLREHPGRNLTIARTEAGERLLRAAVEAGALVAEPSSVEEIDAMHFDHLPRKLGWPARLLAFAALRQPAVRVRGYRPLRMLLRLGPRRGASSFRGALRRVRRGDHREAAPPPR
ncbi:MAG: coenzyme hydrogenase subunit beta [Solirubrobacteraceae bacterium]|nr:coenzyme hydrogenase subunit beta [Solirubrobacteraceae bacterium]